jgi:protein gp37
MANTKIEWATKVWNPVTGCTKVSSGCANCYAERFAKRLQANPKVNGKYVNGFEVTFHSEELYKPFSWRNPQRCFTVSMGDLFHDDVREEWIDQVMAVIACNPKHTFILLTKRPERMHRYFNKPKEELLKAWEDAIYEVGIATKDGDVDAPACFLHNFTQRFWPLPNLWLGVTVENQEQAGKRIPLLLQTVAAIRFVSCEPLLSLINLSHIDAEMSGHPDWYFINSLTGKHTDMGRPCKQVGKIDWVIAGGETGPKARPMHPDWVRSLRDQCSADNVPFFFKSWGEWGPFTYGGRGNPKSDFNWCERGEKWQWMCKVGKKSSGRLLDDKEYNELPNKV